MENNNINIVIEIIDREMTIRQQIFCFALERTRKKKRSDTQSPIKFDCKSLENKHSNFFHFTSFCIRRTNKSISRTYEKLPRPWKLFKCSSERQMLAKVMTIWHFYKIKNVILHEMVFFLNNDNDEWERQRESKGCEWKVQH